MFGFGCRGTGLMNARDISLREIDLTRDLRTLETFDASFTTDRIYRLATNGLSAEFIEEVLPERLTKRYDVSGIRHAVAESELALLAEVDRKAVGFMTVKLEAWNRRVWITHLYVSPKNKNLGLGSRLVDEADRFARKRDARALWLETQNFNYPAIQFYLKRGFRFCGFDESLYDPSVVPGETAIYLSRDL